MSPRLGRSNFQAAAPVSLSGIPVDAARLRDPYFASFLRHSNGQRTRQSLRDFRNVGLWKNKRKALTKVFRIAMAGGSLWTLLESAKGLSVF